MVIGGVVAAALGTIVGLPALRLRGLYLALVTLMAAGAFSVVINAIGFPEGGSGFNGRGGSGAIRNAPGPVSPSPTPPTSGSRSSSRPSASRSSSSTSAPAPVGVGDDSAQ